MSLPLISVLLLLQPLQTACEMININCRTYPKPSVYQDGDLALAGFFPLYSMEEQGTLTQNFLIRPTQEVRDDWYHWKNYQGVLAFLFAIDEINKSFHLLLNLSLGYDLYNAFPSDRKTLQNALLLLSGGNKTLPNYNCQTQKQPVAIITGNIPKFSAQIGSLLELYKSPQVTYGPFDPILSDKDQFSSVYQMATKDSSLAHGVIWLLLHFGWT
ncbi:vomeronasal type-2 receptor 26-like, partial [Tupaia chinensis]|uniref:vomeronasal type-2 receptor 26-like n=1 Tax=Tupaia chinensis TaxID=246437 RepID=UPI0003C8EE73